MSEPKDCPMCGDDPARVAMCQECNGTGHARTSPVSDLAERIRAAFEVRDEAVRLYQADRSTYTGEKIAAIRSVKDAIASLCIDNAPTILAGLAALEADPASEIAGLRSEHADLAMLVKRLARKVATGGPAPELAEKAFDYLKRKGLQGSILRER